VAFTVGAARPTSGVSARAIAWRRATTIVR
jgi:hypothetical protein